MRGTLLFVIILGSLPLALQQPWLGVLVYSWISYMNPHKYAWGAIRTFPVAMVVVVVTLIGMLATKDKRRLSSDPANLLVLALWIMFVITTPFAFNQADAWLQLDKVSKILLMNFVTIIEHGLAVAALPGERRAEAMAQMAAQNLFCGEFCRHRIHLLARRFFDHGIGGLLASDQG
jgi:hypothetical protein